VTFDEWHEEQHNAGNHGYSCQHEAWERYAWRAALEHSTEVAALRARIVELEEAVRNAACYWHPGSVWRDAWFQLPAVKRAVGGGE
jgi:hypothetical protein